VNDAIGSIYAEFESLWTYDERSGEWAFFDKDAPSFLNTLTDIEPGRAYWIIVNDFCNW
jgi:hypothetical protein